MTQRWVAGGVFLLALLVRLAVVHVVARPPANDLLWNDMVGWNLANGHGFTASPHPPYVAGVYRTPAYPALLALVYAVWGHSYAAVYRLQAAVDALTAVLIGLIALRLSTPPLALLTSLVYALNPYSAAFCGFIHQDTLLTFSTTVVLALLVLATVEASRWALWCAVGFFIGLTALVKAFLILLVLLPVAVCVITVRPARRALGALLGVGLGTLLAVTPWTIRNYQEFHRFVPLAVGGTGGDLGLLLEELDGGEQRLIDRLAERNPEYDASRYLETFVDGPALVASEMEAGRVHRAQLLQRWPRFLLMCLGHMPRLWLTRQTLQYGGIVPLAAVAVSWAFALPGLVGMLWLAPKWRNLLPLYGLVLLITVIYAPYPVEARYTLPAHPAMGFFVAAALGAGWERLRRSSKS